MTRRVGETMESFRARRAAYDRTPAGKVRKARYERTPKGLLRARIGQRRYYYNGGRHTDSARVAQKSIDRMTQELEALTHGQR